MGEAKTKYTIWWNIYIWRNPKIYIWRFPKWVDDALPDFFLSMFATKSEKLNFCMLILYTATVLNVFISSRDLYVVVFRVSYIENPITCRKGYTNYSHFSLNSSSSLIIAKISNSLLKHEHSCLVPDIHGSVLIFLHLA